MILRDPLTEVGGGRPLRTTKDFIVSDTQKTQILLSMVKRDRTRELFAIEIRNIDVLDLLVVPGIVAR